MKISKGLQQCYVLQEALFAAHEKLKDSPRDLALVCTAWERLEERKRILRGKPLPGSCRPAPQKERGFKGLSSLKF